VAESLDIPVVRVERIYPPRDASVVWCRDYDDAMSRMEADGVTRLLALTGVQTITRLKPYWSRYECWFRILNREESIAKAREQGFDPSRLLFYEQESESELIERLAPQAILTKESGTSGGFGDKLDAARKAGSAKAKMDKFGAKRDALDSQIAAADAAVAETNARLDQVRAKYSQDPEFAKYEEMRDNGVDLARLKPTCRMVAAAAGKSKAEAIISILRHTSHYLLVTDQGAAERMLQILEK
jgi:hypothetical protein